MGPTYQKQEIRIEPITDFGPGGSTWKKSIVYYQTYRYNSQIKSLGKGLQRAEKVTSWNPVSVCKFVGLVFGEDWELEIRWGEKDKKVADLD